MSESAGTNGPWRGQPTRRGTLSRSLSLLAALSGVLGMLAGGGCAEQNGVLEVESGAPIRFSRGLGGAGAPVYAVHLGESFSMRFRAKIGDCDYAVLHDEAAGKYFDCGAPAAGRFEWVYSVAETAQAGAATRLMVRGYAQKAARDCMPIRGELVEGDRPDDPKDWRIAEAAVVIEPYQSVLDTSVVLHGARPDWGLSKLLLRRSDGSQTTIKAASGQGRGFAATGPDEQGRWQVRYEPAYAEVNASGETSAELVVADEEGRTTVFRDSFSTP